MRDSSSDVDILQEGATAETNRHIKLDKNSFNVNQHPRSRRTEGWKISRPRGNLKNSNHC